MLRVDIKPELLRWARKRAGLGLDDLIRKPRFKKLEDWEAGELKPTLKQVEAFAKATHTPVGYFFLPEPPTLETPIPDFRTMGSRGAPETSPDLRDTIHLCMRRQDWYRDYARINREDPRPFVGSVSTRDGIVNVAEAIRQTLEIDVDERSQLPSWEAALRQLIIRAEQAGILVMCSGIVGNNTHRVLDPEEFRGFALADDLAPLIFVNWRDTKAARMFTLAHELAHLWLGQSAISDADLATFGDHEVETWCNRVAAETLVPLAILKDVGESSRASDPDEIQRLARFFKVSTLVIIRRIHDAGWISRSKMWRIYEAELKKLLAVTKKDSGGDFYATQPIRASRRFATSLVLSTLSGQTLYTEAFRLLGIKKTKTLHDLGESLGIPT